MEVLSDERRVCRKQQRGRKSGKEMKGSAKGLVGWQEDVVQTQARPADRTSFRRKPDCLALNAPAEPRKKLVFLAFDEQGVTSNPERSDDRLVQVQFAHKPFRPFRHSRDSMDMH